MPTLYVVATPIGNLEDVTLRALRVLEEVGLIAAEDTRTTRKLLSRHGIKTPLVSYHEHNRTSRIPELLSALETSDVALVSDAGTPAVSDPGRELVASAEESGVTVVPVPGASALTACLAVGGLTAEGVLFLGFLPRRKGDRRRLLDSVATHPYSLVVFEAPHRLRAALEAMLETLGDRRITACRELTKIHEEVFRGTVSEALNHFDQPRGEFTIMIEGARMQEAELDPGWAATELSRLKAEGARAREAVDAVAAATGRRKKELYRLWLDTPRQPG